MNNTTNWNLYKSSTNRKVNQEQHEPEIHNNELLTKIKLIEKAFK
jgi:hypothetical protein